MKADVDARERRLRREAERQSLYVNLASLRNQENSYIVAQAVIPELLTQQISEILQQIKEIEDELLELQEAAATPAQRPYWNALKAEADQDSDSALRLYKQAARQNHPDANAAHHSLRYRLKSRDKSAARKSWEPVPVRRPGKFPLGVIALLLILLLVAIFVLGRYLIVSPEGVTAETDVTSPAPAPSDLVVIVPSTSTPIPTNTPTNTPVLTPTPPPTPTDLPAQVSTATEAPPTATRTPVPTLRAAPRVIGPRDGLVWQDGAIVFEFEDLDLPFDELYCLDTMRGYDRTLTENWSFPPVGSQDPSIVIDASVFRIAEIQDIRCIDWTVYIGKETCDTAISRSSQRRIIGLPQPCDLK